MTEHNITLFEACEILNKSKKTLSRYIRRGKLNPQRVKSQQGTLEYRFTKGDLDTLRVELARIDTQGRLDETGGTRHDRQDTLPPEKTTVSTPISEIIPTQDQIRQDRPDKTGRDEGIITLLKDTTELLKHQLTIKDKQIGTLNDQVHKLIDRDRETNVLLKGLQDKLMLSGPQQPIETTDKTGQGRARRSRGERARLLVLIVLLLLTVALYFYTNILPTARPNLKLFYEDLIK